MNELGLFEEYGNIIISIALILYGFLYTFLDKEYGSADEID